jgi:hypothetical protein
MSAIKQSACQMAAFAERLKSFTKKIAPVERVAADFSWTAYRRQQSSDVRFWPKADIAAASANVRFWVKSGHVQVPIITLIGSYLSALFATKYRLTGEIPLDSVPNADRASIGQVADPQKIRTPWQSAL